MAKSASKAPSGVGAAASASNAAELKALQEEVAALKDQVSPALSFCFLSVKIPVLSQYNPVP